MPPQFDIYPLRDPGLFFAESPGIFMGSPNALWAPSPQLINSWRSATSYPNYAQLFMHGYPQPPPVPRVAEAVALRHAARYNSLGYQNLLLRDNGTVIGATPETTPRYVQAGPIQWGPFGPILPVAEAGQYAPIRPQPAALPNPVAPPHGGYAPPPPRSRIPTTWGYPTSIPMMQSRGTSPWEPYGTPYYFSVPVEGPPGYQAFMTNLAGFPIYTYTQNYPTPPPPPFNIQLATADTNPAENPDWAALPGHAASAVRRGAAATWGAARRAPSAVAGAFSGVSWPLMAGGIGAGVVAGAYEYGRATAQPRVQPQQMVFVAHPMAMQRAFAPKVRANPDGRSSAFKPFALASAVTRNVTPPYMHLGGVRGDVQGAFRRRPCPPGTHPQWAPTFPGQPPTSYTCVPDTVESEGVDPFRRFVSARELGPLPASNPRPGWSGEPFEGWPPGYTGMARQAVLEGRASLPPAGYDPYRGCPPDWGYGDFADGSAACLPPLPPGARPESRPWQTNPYTSNMDPFVAGPTPRDSRPAPAWIPGRWLWDEAPQVPASDHRASRLPAPSFPGQGRSLA